MAVFGARLIRVVFRLLSLIIIMIICNRTAYTQKIDLNKKDLYGKWIRLS